MALAINKTNCNNCGECVRDCPFGAILVEDGYPAINAACKMCGICVKSCGQEAILLIDDARQDADKSAFSGILVYGEVSDGKLHPVARELMGKALKLAEKTGEKVSAVVIAGSENQAARELLSYGAHKVYTYEHEALGSFKADSFAACFADAIDRAKPSIVLTGATSVGRSLAPRVSTRLRTGLTADCTGLEITDDGDLLQIRPAFGGNIMAEIITPRTRPQFATVRYKVMDEAEITEPNGEIVSVPVKESMIKSGIELISKEEKPPSENISEAEVLVVGGKGLKTKDDLEMVKALAKKLNGQYAVTRPLVEAGWAPQIRQIGLSGRTVKPKLIITFGVSGAVQFTAAMKDSECIFAVNSDAQAPIMDIAHYCVVGNLYEILPGLLEA